MPLPTPRQGEARGKFLLRSMADETTRSEFPDSGQRYAVCNSQAARRTKAEAATEKRPEASGYEKTL